MAAVVSLQAPAAAQTPAPATSVTAPGVVRLEADQQRREGPVVYADGNVDVHYGDMRLRADHVQYNNQTYDVVASGRVDFDHDTEHIRADHAKLNAKTGKGQFEKVSGDLTVQRQPNPSVLVTPNPLTFNAARVDRLDATTYQFFHARLTVCDPEQPTWTFDADEATLRVDNSVALLNANFRLFRIPLFYFPYTKLPAGRRGRQSGFLVPEISRSSIRGEVLGDSFYWAPSNWADATVGAQWLSLRGSAETGEVRMKPSENVDFSAEYSGVVDRLDEGGHRINVKLNAQLGDGWRAVADYNELSSFLFQEVFSPTFTEAITSEVNSTLFLSNHFDGFTFNFADNSYKDFLTALPETSISLRNGPEARLDSQDQAPWKQLPVYFGLDSYADAASRSDTEITTPEFVGRTDFAPRVTVPLRWGSWLGVTPTYSFQITRYSASEANGSILDAPVLRTDGQLSVDFRPPTFERVWQGRTWKWKHTIQPDIVYGYVTGIDNFSRIIRFDEDDTLTDTNEIQYSITQRLFRRKGTGAIEELASWTLLQKYYFDPTFGGALLPGVRNVFEALDSVTPFAFADGLRRFSPLVSDFKITPGGRYDAELRTDFDPQLGRITSTEALLKVHPYGDLNLTLADYDIHDSPVLQPFSNQVRALVGYRQVNQKGWNVSVGFSYDFLQGIAENELAQVGYNSSCCGLILGYQRLNLGNVRDENQFRVSFVIANLGTFGNTRRPEKIF